MKSTFFKSSFFIFVVALDISGTTLYASPNGYAHLSDNVPMNNFENLSDEEQLKTAIADVFTKFANNVGMFKSQLQGLIDINSNEKLKDTCEKLNTAIEQAEELFIAPLREKHAQLKTRASSNSNYYQLLEVLLDAADELKGHFNRVYTVLHRSLQGRPTAVKVARAIKPVIDQVTADNNFFSIDACLERAAELTSPYDIVIDISPEILKQITDEHNVNEIYSIALPQAIAHMREGLEELRVLCRKPSTLSAGELLRMIRKRL